MLICALKVRVDHMTAEKEGFLNMLFSLSIQVTFSPVPAAMAENFTEDSVQKPKSCHIY